MAKDHDDSFSKNRMESLTDGIFATVMTILILSLVVPILTGPSLSQQQLATTIYSLLPSVLIYVFSFTVLLVLWIGHNNIFRYLHNIHPKMLWVNGLFLLFIGLVPFSTAFLGRYPLQQPAIILYGINFLLLTIMFRVFTNYIKSSHHEIDTILSKTSRNGFVPFALYVAAMAFSFLTPYLSLLLFALMPIFYIYQAFFGMYKEMK